MRAISFGIIVLSVLLAGTFRLTAQTNPPVNAAPTAASGDRENALISFLSPEEQQKYAVAHAKALADNPQLKAEGDKLKSEGPSMLIDGTASDRQAFMEKMLSHRQKLRQAMLKEDPSLPPIFAEIDKHLSAMRAKQLSSIDNSGNTTNAPPANPPANP